MRQYFAILFGLLLTLSIFAWIGGKLTGAVVPWFGGVPAERIGQVAFAVSLCGEGFVYLFGWLFKRLSDEPRRGALGLPGTKRYGNKQPVA